MLLGKARKSTRDERFRDKFKNVRSKYNAAAVRILHFEENSIFVRVDPMFFNDETNTHRFDAGRITRSTYFLRVLFTTFYFLFTLSMG